MSNTWRTSPFPQHSNTQAHKTRCNFTSTPAHASLYLDLPQRVFYYFLNCFLSSVILVIRLCTRLEFLISLSYTIGVFTTWHSNWVTAYLITFFPTSRIVFFVFIHWMIDVGLKVCESSLILPRTSWDFCQQCCSHLSAICRSSSRDRFCGWRVSVNDYLSLLAPQIRVSREAFFSFASRAIPVHSIIIQQPAHC